MTGLPILVNLARPRGQADAVEVARATLASGLSGIGLADSPRLFPDPLVETARVLATVPDVIAGPCVLSLPLLHVARAASALGALADAFPGRVTAVVGRGESSLANEGLRPPGLAEYAEMLTTLRDLVAPDASALRLLGAASGPRTIGLTAQVLGGVLLDVGTEPAAVAAAVRHARAAAPQAGVWAFVRLAIADTPADALAAAAPLLGSCAARMARSPQWYGVDEATQQQLAELAAAHDYRRHGTDSASPAGVSAEPGLAQAAERVRERFLFAGPVEQVARRFRDLAATGVDGLVLAGGLPGVITRLPELGAAARDVVRYPAVVGGVGPRFTHDQKRCP